MPDYPCGCRNEVDTASGVLCSVMKCEYHTSHQRRPEDLDQQYYQECGSIKDGVIQAAHYLDQLVEALGPITPPSFPGAHALEIGCGISPYAAAIEAAGYAYCGLDPSVWACLQMSRRYNVICSEFAAFNKVPAWSLILASHVFEHLPGGPEAIRQAAGMLTHGGELWVIVPDDSDPVNPDHLFFFTEDSLCWCVRRAGLKVERVASFQRVEREKFIYLRAVKP